MYNTPNQTHKGMRMLSKIRQIFAGSKEEVGSNRSESFAKENKKEHAVRSTQMNSGRYIESIIDSIDIEYEMLIRTIKNIKSIIQEDGFGFLSVKEKVEEFLLSHDTLFAMEKEYIYRYIEESEHYSVVEKRLAQEFQKIARRDFRNIRFCLLSYVDYGSFNSNIHKISENIDRAEELLRARRSKDKEEVFPIFRKGSK